MQDTDNDVFESAVMWPRLVTPLVEMCSDAETERAIPASTMALAMVAAGWNVIAGLNGPEAAAVALLAALDALRKENPDAVAVAESAQHLHRVGLH
ncbi:MAG: hypothetical protein U1E16_03975 [Hyphomicrobiales bacterium]